MTIKPIISAMLRTKTGPALIIMQIAITVAIVAIAGFIIHERYSLMQRPTGMDDGNLVFARVVGFGESFDRLAMYQRDKEALSAIPGVASVGYMDRPPLTGSGNNSGFFAGPNVDQEPAHNANYWNADETTADALGIKIIEGRNFTRADVALNNDDGEDRVPNALITRAFADDLFGDESAAGKMMYNGLGNPVRVVGVVEHMHGAWVNWSRVDRNVIYAQIEDSNSLAYAIRVEPGLADQMVPTIEAKLQEIDRERVVNSVTTLRQYMDISYSADTAMIKMLSAVSLLLLAVTALGLIGLTAFNVNQRRKQIGTRRALGATQGDILTYFLTETALLAGIGSALGCGLALALNWWLGAQFNLSAMDAWYLLPACAGLFTIAILSVLGPARKATLISPAMATRSV
jgi:putative ABC transport system permease protein